MHDDESADPALLSIDPVSPVCYFAISAECSRYKFDSKKEMGDNNKLPDLTALCGERSFADVFLGWHEDGIAAQVVMNCRSFHVEYPAIEQGNSVELFFDTRDVKTSRWNTRFCHHFFFLPEGVDGVIAGERTHFRTEDKHELCDAAELQVNVTRQKQGYRLSMFIPSQCLFGYDPAQFDRLGFTYRINAHKSDPQHFSASSADYMIAQQPWLWSSLTLVK